MIYNGKPLIFKLDRAITHSKRGCYAKKSLLSGARIFLSKPQVWYIITLQRVYHQLQRSCISSRQSRAYLSCGLFLFDYVDRFFTVLLLHNLLLADDKVGIDYCDYNDNERDKRKHLLTVDGNTEKCVSVFLNKGEQLACQEGCTEAA